MTRRWLSHLPLCAILAIAPIGLGGWGPPGLTFAPIGSTRIVIAQSRVPMILPSSGSVANNGALTLTTALDQAYPAAYFYMKLGAIATASPAGFYYGTMQSTTAVTLFNNLYVSGSPTIPTSPTAFATTGPGAYTQTTGAGLVANTVVVPGGTLGVNDEIQSHGLISYPNSAGAKTLTLGFGAFTYTGNAPTTTVSFAFQGGVANAGSLSRQNLTATNGGILSTSAAVPTNGSVNSAANANLTVNLNLAVATDYMILQSYVAERVVAANN